MKTNVYTPAQQIEKKQGPALPSHEKGSGDQLPTKPIEPVDNSQPEIPKVGTTDAPGG